MSDSLAQTVKIVFSPGLPEGMRFLTDAEDAELTPNPGAYVDAIVVWLAKDEFVHPIFFGLKAAKMTATEIQDRIEGAARSFQEAIAAGIARPRSEYLRP